jgi:translation initiation factor 3 subunit D
MTAPKSLYSWDVIIKKYQDKLFIDKRDDENILDFLTVNETSHENQPVDDDTVNGVRQIMREALVAQNNVLAQQQGKSQDFKHSFNEKDPFIETEG